MDDDEATHRGPRDDMTLQLYPPGVDMPPAKSLFGGLRHALRPRWRSVWISVGLVLAVALALLFTLPKPHADAVREIDPSHAIAQASSWPGFPVYVPSPLPAGWHPNSARFDQGKRGPHLHIGYLTPDNAYAGLEESSGAQRRFFVTDMGAGAVFQDVVVIDGQLWVRVTSDRKKQDSLVWYGPKSVVVVTGTTTVANLKEFAATLHVGR